jgi:kinesin family member 11
MTKRALIREYITAIERLKQDLSATREKNGIFLSEESYNTLVNESASRKDQVEEAQKSMDSTLEEMKLLKERFEQQVGILNETSTKLEECMSELEQKQEELNLSIQQSQVLQKRLREQYYVTEYGLLT